MPQRKQLVPLLSRCSLFFAPKESSDEGLCEPASDSLRLPPAPVSFALALAELSARRALSGSSAAAPDRPAFSRFVGLVPPRRLEKASSCSLPKRSLVRRSN